MGKDDKQPTSSDDELKRQLHHLVRIAIQNTRNNPNLHMDKLFEWQESDIDEILEELTQLNQEAYERGMLAGRHDEVQAANLIQIEDLAGYLANRQYELRQQLGLSTEQAAE